MSTGRPRTKPGRVKPDDPNKKRPPGRKRGAQLMLTDQLCDDMIALLQNGITIAIACEATGISVETYYHYMQKGEVSPEDSLYGKFYKGCKAARALGEVALVNVIQKHSKDDPKWAAWLLERMHGERYGAKDNIDITHNGSIAHEHRAIIVNFPGVMAKPRLPLPERPAITIEPRQDKKRKPLPMPEKALAKSGAR